MEIPREAPTTDEGTVLFLRECHHEMERAADGFEELWAAAGRGERLPDEEAARLLLGALAGRARLMELGLGWLRILREEEGRATR